MSPDPGTEEDDDTIAQVNFCLIKTANVRTTHLNLLSTPTLNSYYLLSTTSSSQLTGCTHQGFSRRRQVSKLPSCGILHPFTDAAPLEFVYRLPTALYKHDHRNFSTLFVSKTLSVSEAD